MTNQLNKNSSIPLYQQLGELIKDQIATGKLKESDRLMPEIDLSKAYDVSRITVRKAIDLLVEEDILIKCQGVGTFIAGMKLKRVINTFNGFTDLCEKDGIKASTELLKADLIDATANDIQKLELNDVEKVIRIIRLRKCDGIPVMIEENIFSTKYAYLLAEDLASSIYEVLRKHNSVPTQAVKTIDICYANEDEAKYLDVAFNSALLLQKDIIYDKDKVPLHLCKTKTNPARYKMTVLCS
ncbi:MAG: GntR family transcriptional regulator [Herbinix sp.]|nr:GntR family transcriptional regulator [Herbinix sp.]